MTRPCLWHEGECGCRPRRRELPAHVRAFVLEYTAAADRGDIVAVLRMRPRWPEGLTECPCETGEEEGPDGRSYPCDACGGLGLYYDEPEANKAAAESEAA